MMAKMSAPWANALLVLMRAAAGVALAPAALAGDGGGAIDWANPMGGDYFDAANWQPKGVPGPGDLVRFDLGHAYAVTFAMDEIANLPVAEVAGLLIRRDEVLFDLSGAMIRALGEQSVAVRPPFGFAALVVAGGAVESQDVHVGGSGLLSLAALTVSHDAQWRIRGDLLEVDGAGAASLAVLSNGSIGFDPDTDPGFHLAIGALADVLVSGENSALHGRSALAHGDLVIADGALVELDGAGGGPASFLDALILIGDGSALNIGGAAAFSAHELLIKFGADVHVDSTAPEHALDHALVLGDGASFSATSGHFLLTHSLHVLAGGHFDLGPGALTANEAEIVVDGDGSALSAANLTLIGPGSRGTDVASFELGDGATAQIGALRAMGDAHISVPALRIGTTEVATASALHVRSLGVTQDTDLEVEGEYVQAADGALSFAIDRPLVPAPISSQTASLRGTLLIQSAPPNPPVGATFPLIATSGPSLGQFDLVITPPLPGGKFLRVVPADLVAAGGGGATVIVDSTDDLLEFGEQPPSSLGAGLPKGAAVVDVNDDGLVDLAVALSDDPMLPGSLQVLLNQGVDAQTGDWLGFSGGFQIAVGIDPSDVAHIDYDSDDDIDFAVTNRGDDTVTLIRNELTETGMLSFAIEAVITVGDEPVSIESGDLDQFGGPDLVTANFGDDTVSILLNNLAGRGLGGIFDVMGAQTTPDPCSVCPSDVDNDGGRDIIVTAAGIPLGARGDATGGTVDVLLSLGGGDFAPRVSFSVGPDPVEAEIVDLNDDGLKEIITADKGGATLSILRNLTGPARGAGGLSFADALTIVVGDAPSSLAVLDVDNDGDADLVNVSGDGMGGSKIGLLQNTTLDPEQIQFAAQLVLLTDVGTLLVESGDVNNDGLPDVIGVNSDGDIDRGAAGTVIVVLNETRPRLLGDLSGDNFIDMEDLAWLLALWGPCPTPPAPCIADLTGDGNVDAEDLAILLGAWTGPPPPR